MSDALLQPQPGGSAEEVSVCRNEVLLSQGHHPEPRLALGISRAQFAVCDLLFAILSERP
jgi:hypothetical protein